MEMSLPRPRLRVPPRALVIAAAALLVAAGGYLWFRDSSFVRVQDVFITGTESSERERVRAALRSAALDMTTLNVREDVLDTAVAPFSSVRELRVEASFPHKLTIEVVEHAPVAALQAGSSRVPVNAEGLVLRGVRASDTLATVRVDRVPAERLEPSDREARDAIAVLAAAPEPLLERARRAWFASKGLTVELRDGPPLIFGDATDAALKWASAARVLADPEAAGAAYLDVRVPGRVAAGGLAPLVEATATPVPTAVPAVPTATPIPTATPVPTPIPTATPVAP